MNRAGSASIDITPPLGLTIQAATHSHPAEIIRDPLEANALYLAGPDASVVLVNCDLAGMEPDMVVAIRDAAGSAAGLDPRSIIITCTHTHGGPVMMPTNRYSRPDKAYHAQLRANLVEVVKRACAAAQPVRLAWGVGHAPLGYNRRVCFADGSHAMHGDAHRADFTGLEGPDDHRHIALFVNDVAGKTIAVVYNNTSHPTTFYGGNCFSADFPGAVRKQLRSAIEPGLAVLFLNGAQGDICMIDLLADQPHAESQDRKIARLADLAAGETLRLLYEAHYRNDAIIKHIWTELKVDVRLPAPEHLVWARKILAEADKLEDKANVQWDVLRAHGADLLDRAYGTNPVDHLPLHAIRIGDLGLATVPCELYCQFGLDIKRRSPAPLTAIVGLADGSHGYCPTMAGILGGGYSGEPIFWTRLAENAGYKLVDEGCRMLHELWR